MEDYDKDDRELARQTALIRSAAILADATACVMGIITGGIMWEIAIYTAKRLTEPLGLVLACVVGVIVTLIAFIFLACATVLIAKSIKGIGKKRR